MRIKPFTLPALLVLLCLLVFTGVGGLLFANAPAWQRVGSITPEITGVNADTTLRWGYQALGQYPGLRSADAQHLQLQRENGKWWLSNLAAHKNLLYSIDGGNSWRNPRHWNLQQGDTFQLDNTQLLVKTLDADSLTLETPATQQQAHWQAGWLGLGGSLRNNGQAPTLECPNDRMGRDAGFFLGGNVQCNTRWALQGVPVKAATIRHKGGGFVLEPNRNDAAVVRASHAGGEPLDLMLQQVPLTNGDKAITHLIVGKTTYKVTQAEDGTPRLDAQDNVHLFSPDTLAAIAATGVDKPPMQSFQWVSPLTGKEAYTDATNWRNLAKWAVAVLALSAASWLAALLGTNTQHPHLWHNARWVLSLQGLLLWGAWWGQHLPMLAATTGLAWLVLTVLLWRRSWLSSLGGWVWCMALFLVGFGLLVQMQLALGAADTHWHLFASRQAMVLLGIAWGLSLLGIMPPHLVVGSPDGQQAGVWEHWTTNGRGILRERWVLGFSVVVLLAFSYQLVAGSEMGVGGFQPAEFAKLLLAMLLAMAAVNVMDLQHFSESVAAVVTFHRKMPRLTLWLRLLFWVLLVGLLAFGVLAFGVHDFSPVLILTVLGLAFAWAIRGRLPRWLRWLVTLLPFGFVLIGVAAWWSPAQFVDALQILGGAKGERLLVWANPWGYPDLGLQLQRSLQAIHVGGWLGHGWFGENGAIMAMPEVQNDFILGFVLFKAGAGVGLLLLVVQLGWVGLLFSLHSRLLASQTGGRNRGLAMQWLAWLLFGLAWLQMAHWLIAWSNVLGLLPIMGQPMTWLASGNSHLLALGLPTLLLALVAAQAVPTRRKP